LKEAIKDEEGEIYDIERNARMHGIKETSIKIICCIMF
jgi:hypothetical protein